MNSLAVVIVTVIVLVFLFCLERKLKKIETHGQARGLMQEIIKCAICGGSGKIWEETHDSADLQITNCLHCKGSGKIQLNTAAKKKRDKPTRPWRAKRPKPS